MGAELGRRMEATLGGIKERAEEHPNTCSRNLEAVPTRRGL